MINSFFTKVVTMLIFLSFFIISGTVSASGTMSDMKMRDIILSYMGDPTFSGENFVEKLTGVAAKVEMVDFEKQMVYFSLDREDYGDETESLIGIDSNQIEFGRTSADGFLFNTEEQKSIVLGPYQYMVQDRYLFRTPAENINFSNDKVLPFLFGEVVYDLSLDELTGYLQNTPLYRGRLKVVLDKNKRSVFYNHGVYVAKKEPSLERLVGRLVQAHDSMEVKVQKLLDFVTNEIEYDSGESYGFVEALKRPNEVLMSGRSDCSGKVILFASFLEQVGADYRIVYTASENDMSHTFVIVAGNFPMDNQQSLALGDRNFFFAETAIEGFKIGRSVPGDNLMSNQKIVLLQRPGEDSIVTNAWTGDPLNFL